MREDAIAEIYGNLESDIVIKEIPDGKKYGIITVSVLKKSLGNINTNDDGKRHYFPVLIWNQEYLSTEARHLKKDRRVLIIGKLGILEQSLEPGAFSPAIKKVRKGDIVINVFHLFGVTILSKIPAEEKADDNNDLLFSKTTNNYCVAHGSQTHI